MSDKLDFHASQVLITGGSDGIGLGLAARFLAVGATVLVTGRALGKLQRAAELHPGLLTFVSDMGIAEERERLAAHVRESMAGLTVLINNAGVQRRVALAEDQASWPERQAEIDILLSGPVHLNHLLAPMMRSHKRASLIANVTSGGAYVPQPFAPVYSACKAALHSYTMNLRFALAGTTCRVVEIIPPAVRTALMGPGAAHGAPLDEFCDATFAALLAGEAVEIGFGMTSSPPLQERLRMDHQLFDSLSGRFPVKTYR
jgi:uncharacterized oxidoreductase